MISSSGRPSGPNNANIWAPLCLGIVPLFAVIALFPASAPAAGAPGQFVSSINAVEVYASVAGEKGEPAPGLRREDFELLEDGVVQTIDTFAEGDFTLAVALAVDRSVSMKGERLKLAQGAARAFLEALRPEDRALVLAVGSQVEEVAPLSADRAAQLDAIARLDPWGTTPLHDAIADGIERIQQAGGRRALVLLSDGDERYSTRTAADVTVLARQSDVMIFPVALGRVRPTLFAELAALTGGRSLHVRDPRALAEALAGIARELRHQYLLGYTPARPLSERGGWRSIAVRVRRPGLRVRARDGYLVR
jgi:Ca-activated chloride channel homolog